MTPNSSAAGKHAQHRHLDPVAHTQRDLDKLAQNLNLKDQQKVAQDTRGFEGVLSPEQKTIFDLYWKTQFHQRMGHRPLA